MEIIEGKFWSEVFMEKSVKGAVSHTKNGFKRGEVFGQRLVYEEISVEGKAS